MNHSKCVSIAALSLLASYVPGVHASGGALDPSFGGNGIAVTAIDLVAGGSDNVWDLVVADDGSVYQIAAAKDSQGWRHVISKLTPQGNVDYGYGSFGMALLPQADPDVAAFGALMGNGNVLIATAEWDSVNLRNEAVLRQYKPDGSLDAQAFGGAGKFVLNNFPGARLEYVSGVAVDAQGRIVLAGITARHPALTLQMMVARILPNGTLDTSFGGGIRQGSPLPQYPTTLRAMRVLSNDAVIVGGAVERGPGDWDFALWKITSAGADDTTFGSGGFQTVWFDVGGPHMDYLADLEVRPDGSIMAVGHAHDVNRYEYIAITVLNASGQVDQGFGNQSPKDGRFLLNLASGDYHQAEAVTRRANGSLIVALSIDVGSGLDFGALQFTPQGNLDTGFGFLGLRHYPFNYGIDEEIASSIAVDAQDRVLIGGWARYSQTDNDLIVMRVQP